MDEHKKCPTFLISDAPADQDSFKSHDRVANAIIDLVNNEKGGLTIGVEGAWGTGKSTIINLVGKSLSSNPDIAFISFDAWAHQGDPLRRSFLERLINVIQKKNWVDKKKWDGVLAALAKRIHKSSTTKTPVLTTSGKWFAAALVAVPGGAAMLEPLIEVWIWPREPIDAALRFSAYALALALSFAPLLVIGVLLGRSKVKNKRKIATACTNDSEENLPSFAFIASEQTTREDSESTEEPEPTSLEFSKRFSELLDDALVKDDPKKVKVRKVVVVVDNLDRIPEDVARSMWATMRTFLEYGEYERPDWFSRIWVVVPYAMESLKKTLNATTDKTGIFSFIDKVFQIHFYVSPPVLSDWKDYLAKHVRVAFPTHTKDSELHRIYRTWTQNADRKERPTPRDLVIFVNDIGALHRQWGDEFPLPHMAYYCLIRRRYDDVAAELLNGTIPAPADRELLGENLADTVAALYFNRDVAHAKQILLKPELTRLLAKGVPNELIEFEQKHAGLFAVLEQQLKPILSEWQTAETATIGRAAKCLLSEGVLSKASPAEAEPIRSYLFDICKGVQYWNPLDGDVIEGLALTVAANGTVEYAEIVLLALKGSYEKGEFSKKPDIPDASAWIGFYLHFIKEIKSRGLLPKLDGKDFIPGAQREWVLAGQYLTDIDSTRDLTKTITPNTDFNSIVQEYVRVINNDTFAKPHLESLLSALKVQLGLVYLQVAQVIQKRLEENAATTSSRAYSLLYAIWKMGEKAADVKPIEMQLSSTGGMLHYLQVAIGSKDNNTAAFIVYLMTNDRPQLTQDRHIHSSQAGYDNISSMFNEPSKYPEIRTAFISFIKSEAPFGIFQQMLINAPTARKWLCDCAAKMAEERIMVPVFDAQAVLSAWGILDDADRTAGTAPTLLPKLIYAVNEDGAFNSLLVKTVFNVDSSRLYKSVIVNYGTPPPELRAWLQAGLDTVSQEIWAAQMQSDGELMSLLEVMRAKDESIKTGVVYLDALIALANQTAEGKGIGNRPEDKWPAYFESLKSDLRRNFGEKLLEIAKAKKGNIHPQFFSVFGREAFDLKVIKNDDEVVPKILTEYVINRNVAGLTMIKDILNRNDRKLGGLGKSHHITEFEDRIRNALAQTVGDGSDPLIKEISTQLNISEKKPDNDEDTETPK